MPRKVSNALTPLTVKNAKPGRHADGGGLHLLVKPSGAMSWVFRFMLNGRSRDAGLGPAGNGGLSLAAARDAAAALRLKVRAGVDPLDEREKMAAEAKAAELAAKAKAITFKQVAEIYISSNEGAWRNAKHRQQWRNTLETYAYPVIGALPAGDVSTAHVLQILEPIWAIKPETASRVRGRIETVLDAAKARGYRDGENVARWRGHLKQLLPARAKLARGHHAALAYAEMPAFMEALRERDAMAARALEFAILTASRTSEVIGAKWGEVDLARALWTIPAARMKAKREHVIPLSPRALEVLKSLLLLNPDDRADAPLFPAASGDKLSSMAMLTLLRRMHAAELKAGRSGWVDRKQDGRMITAHGFRSTFRDWAGERSAFPREVVEHALAHQLADKAEAAYQRSSMLPKRDRLMKAWADYCSTPVSTDGENVRLLREGRAV